MYNTIPIVLYSSSTYPSHEKNVINGLYWGWHTLEHNNPIWCIHLSPYRKTGRHPHLRAKTVKYMLNITTGMWDTGGSLTQNVIEWISITTSVLATKTRMFDLTCQTYLSDNISYTTIPLSDKISFTHMACPQWYPFCQLSIIDFSYDIIADCGILWCHC